MLNIDRAEMMDRFFTVVDECRFVPGDTCRVESASFEFNAEHYKFVVTCADVEMDAIWTFELYAGNEVVLRIDYSRLSATAIAALMLDYFEYLNRY